MILLDSQQYHAGLTNFAQSCDVQVVAFQATMELMAQQFPGAFAGYKLEVTESHQRTKVDTSGTAKAIMQSFQKMGLDFQEVYRHSSNASGSAYAQRAMPVRCCPLSMLSKHL